MQASNRLVIYSVACFICFLVLAWRKPTDPTLLPLLGFFATAVGIWIEMRFLHLQETDENKPE